MLIQQAAGSYIAGKWEPGAETRTALTVVSAPPSGATARDVLPEGARLRDARTFWLEEHAEPIRVGEGQTEGDIIEYDSTRFRISDVQDWRPHGFIEVLGIREENQAA